MIAAVRIAAGGRRRQAGSSVVEILVASTIAILVLGALMVLMLEGAREQSWGIVEARLHTDAGLLQDRLTRLIREMGATESTVFGTPLSEGSPFYRRMVVARGKHPTHPREEIIYNPANMTLVHDPDRTVSGNEMALHGGDSPIKVRNAYFFSSMKPGGVPDGGSINVWFEMDDDGATGRQNPDGTSFRVSVVRSFTVTMRNP